MKFSKTSRAPWRFLLLLSLASLTLLGGGCVISPRTPVLPYYGTLFNHTSAPVDITFNKTRIGDRVGKASAISVLGLISFGDCSIHAAAMSGGIQSVDHVDCELTNILGLFGKYETIVYGRAGP